MALWITVAACVGFGVYGFATRAPSTVSYLFIVVVVGVLLTAFRKTSVSPPVVIGLALLAVAHLAGGLISVGDDVLYNASIGTKLFQYDHFVHASGVFLGTVVLWTFLVRPAVEPSHRRTATAVSVLGGLGLGAINETIEFLTTLAHHGAHVGGYRNTGLDLVSNLAGALVAGLWISRKKDVTSVHEIDA